MADASTATAAPEDTKPYQPGLGDFNKLPLELRRKIWKHFVPREGETNGIRGICQPSRPCHTGDHGPMHEPPPPPTPVNRRGDLAILRASRDLHNEITTELYLNRVLTVCFSDQDHFEGCWKTYEHATPCGRSHFWTTMGGVCYWSDLDEIDFSRFSSVRLNIRFRSEGDAEELAVYLHGEIDHFTKLVQRWRTRKSGNSAECPSLKIGITIDICPQDPSLDDPSPVNEIKLSDIHHLLMMLAKMPNVRVRSVEVGFAVRFGQEWLVELIRQAVKYIERSAEYVGDREGSRLREALERSKEWTNEPLDGRDHGALFLELPSPTLPEGMSVEVRHVPERAFITRFLAVYGWMIDACVVTKVTFA
ncbi:MAG: hypothetical protein LQ346_003953 [Caloplaca aetnensis]|nr:MAG: hypothetical protein LQ346_003953 [Caloplaca aetnensis]